MQEVDKYKFKVCLMGEKAVGKTSLIKRFVFDEFDGEYITTIGTKITKKEFRYQSSDNGTQDVTLMIWDIMGEQGFRKLLQESYFFGAQGIIGIWDVTRKSTLPALYGWMKIIQSVTEEIPVVFLANKSDLVDEQEEYLNGLKNLVSKYDKSEAFLSSAKTGFNVELTFKTLSEKIIEDYKKNPKKQETLI